MFSCDILIFFWFNMATNEIKGIGKNVQLACFLNKFKSCKTIKKQRKQLNTNTFKYIFRCQFFFNFTKNNTSNSHSDTKFGSEKIIRSEIVSLLKNRINLNLILKFENH